MSLFIFRIALAYSRLKSRECASASIKDNEAEGMPTVLKLWNDKTKTDNLVSCLDYSQTGFFEIINMLNKNVFPL